MPEIINKALVQMRMTEIDREDKLTNREMAGRGNAGFANPPVLTKKTTLKVRVLPTLDFAFLPGTCAAYTNA